MKRSTRKSVSLGICALFLLLSCSTVEERVQEHPKTVVGAAAGAAGGAIIGGLIFKNATGAVVGGLLGGLAGGLIGNAFENKTEDGATTAREYGYAREQGHFIRVEHVEAEPTWVEQGGKMNLMTRYALLTPSSDRTTTVAERWEIRKDGQLVGNPVLTVQRESGTWTSAIPITLPDTAREGRYQVRVTVEAGDSRDSDTTGFTVL